MRLDEIGYGSKLAPAMLKARSLRIASKLAFESGPGEPGDTLKVVPKSGHLE